MRMLTMHHGLTFGNRSVIFNCILVVLIFVFHNCNPKTLLQHEYNTSQHSDPVVKIQSLAKLSDEVEDGSNMFIARRYKNQEC